MSDGNAWTKTAIGSKVFPSAQSWLLDENGKIKVERIISYVAPRPPR